MNNKNKMVSNKSLSHKRLYRLCLIIAPIIYSVTKEFLRGLKKNKDIYKICIWVPGKPFHKGNTRYRKLFYQNIFLS